MVTWPSGKARVCKTLIHQFKSGRHLQKSVDTLSADFFVVSVVSLRSQNLRPAIHHVRTFPVPEILEIGERFRRLESRRENLIRNPQGIQKVLNLCHIKAPGETSPGASFMILLYNTAPEPATADDIALFRRQPGSHDCRSGRWRHGQTPRSHHRICRRKAGG